MRIRIFDAGQRERPKSGYGVMARALAYNLGQMGHEICYGPRNDYNENVALWIRPPHYIKDREFGQGVNQGIPNVIYTMHESATFGGWKENWPRLLNWPDAIIVPTEWNKTVFVAHGVTKPIHVIPLGVNSKDFHGNRTYEFSILALHDALGSDASRENWKDTLWAYHETFYGVHRHEVLLTIKSYNIKAIAYQQYIDQLRATRNRVGWPAVRVIDLDLPITALNDLYGQSWLFIKNANREGWGLPLWEALSAGVRVAYTDLPVFEGLIPERYGRKFPVGDTLALTNILADEFRHWKKRKGWINSFNWGRCAEKVELVLMKHARAG